MPELGSYPASVARGFQDLARRARALATRWGLPVLVWASGMREPSRSEWALHARGWVWRKPSAGVSVWAAGCAWEVRLHGPARFLDAASAWGRLAAGAVAEGPVRPVAFAAFAFQTGSTTGPWKSFPDGLLTVPRVLRVRVGWREYLALGCVVGPEEDGEVEHTLQVVDSAREAPAELSGEARLVRCAPEEDRWEQAVKEAEAACRAGHLHKVVVARCVEAAACASADRVLHHLSTRYPTCTTFAVCVQGAVFLGATPETLVRVRGGHVRTQALAGTAPRGRGAEQDEAFRYHLRSSPKEAREHHLVLTHLQQVLRPLCTTLRTGHQTVVRLANVQHLRTTLTGQLREPRALLELAGHLHPTPATAGMPVQAALDWIRAREPVARGWYAGAVGWVDPAGGELAVALRCALLRDGRAWAFAGCGIVAGSDPQREWEESQLKLRPVMEALGMAWP